MYFRVVEGEIGGWKCISDPGFEAVSSADGSKRDGILGACGQGRQVDGITASPAGLAGARRHPAGAGRRGARTALQQYGLLDEPGKTRPAAAPGATEVEQAAATTPRNALERARGVQDVLQQGAIEQQKNIDAAIPK